MGQSDENHYKNYTPSIAAAVVFTIVFAILLLSHLFRIFRTRTWFCIPFAIGAIFEAIGYICRAIGHYKPTSLIPYIIQVLLVLLAPILFAASVYMFLGRLIRFTGAESYSLIRTNRLTIVFVGGDIFCFLVQALGGGMLAGADTKKQQNRGQNIILGGLILQIVIFGFFLLIALVFHGRLRGRPTSKVLGNSFPWERYLVMLYGVSVLITTRNLFRVIEYAMGDSGYLLSHEWPAYVFDALLMIIVLIVSWLWYIRGKITDGAQPINLETVSGGVQREGH